MHSPSTLRVNRLRTRPRPLPSGRRLHHPEGMTGATRPRDPEDFDNAGIDPHDDGGPQATSGTRTPSVFATLQAEDAHALLTYLTETFGFRLTARHDDGDTVAHAELAWPEGAGGVMLGTYREGRTWSRRPGTAGTYVVVKEVDALHDRAQKAGAEVVAPLSDTDYGSREFTVKDPEGNLWSFGTYPGAPMQ